LKHVFSQILHCLNHPLAIYKGLRPRILGASKGLALLPPFAAAKSKATAPLPEWMLMAAEVLSDLRAAPALTP